MIAHNTLHRSGQAELPHPAPTSGHDTQPHERIRVTNSGRREPARKCDAACVATASGYLGCDGTTPSATYSPLLCQTHPAPGRSWAPRNSGSDSAGPSDGAVRLPTSVPHRCSSFAFPTRSAVSPRQTDLGSPASPTRCWRTCTGSLTAQDPGTPCDGGAPGLTFQHSPERRHPGVPAACAAGHGFHGSIRDLYVPLLNTSKLHSRAAPHDLGLLGSLFLNV